MDLNTVMDRIKRSAMLEVDVYEEVEADRTANKEAGLVVVLSSLAAGISRLGDQGVSGLLIGLIVALISWLIWAYLTYLIGTKLLPEESTESDMGEMMRTIGYSSSPGLLRILGFVPALGPLVFSVASIWMLVAMVIAVRQALDYTSTWRAVGVCLIGWFCQIIILLMFLSFQTSVS